MTVPMVAPAPGNAPISPAAMLPMPWPISSLSGLCRLPVIESATREVRRLSTEPSRARMMAGCNACSRNPAGGRPSCRVGNPAGIAPMTGASVNHSTPRAVPAANATSGPGAKRENLRGQRNPTASVTAPMTKALVSMSLTAAGSARTAPIGPPVAPEPPSSGSDCHQHDDDADTRHEARYDDMRRVSHETADLRHAQKHLQEARKDDDRQGFGEARRVAGEHDRHCDGHRCRRTGYLRARAAEHRREETDRDGAIEPGRRAHPRGDAEAEGNGQRHHHRGDPAEDVAP